VASALRETLVGRIGVAVQMHEQATLLKLFHLLSLRPAQHQQWLTHHVQAQEVT